MRALTACVAALCLLVASAPAAGAGSGDLESARRRANAAARRLSDAQTRLATLEVELAELERRAEAAGARLAELGAAVREQAIHQFVHGGVDSPALVAGDLGEAVRASTLARFVTADVEDSVDEYRAVREDLGDARTALEATREDVAAAVADLRRQAAAAQAELQRIERIEAERRAREEARRAAARRAAARGDGDRGAPTPVRSTRAVLGSGPWVCPVQGPRAFTIDYGAPRSGGRRHQGVDILSPRGTPVVAPVAGHVTHRSVSLGGLSFFLRGIDGITYFGTHLSGYGAGGRVSAGTVIGYVGSTGNAGNVNHLHFEMHPGGGGPVNPYPTLRRYC